MPPLLGSQIRSLVRELRSHKLHDPIKLKKKKDLKTEQVSVPEEALTHHPVPQNATVFGESAFKEVIK